VGHDASDDLERHEPDDQDERDRQVPAVGVRTDGVGMAPMVMVLTVMVVAFVMVVVLAHGSVTEGQHNRKRCVHQARWGERASDTNPNPKR
jgi:hypothetical protein